MRLNKKDLLSGLNKINKVSTRATVPIIDKTVMLTAKHGLIELTANNLDQCYTCSLQAVTRVEANTGPKCVVVPVGKLLKAVKACENGIIGLNMFERSVSVEDIGHNFSVALDSLGGHSDYPLYTEGASIDSTQPTFDIIEVKEAFLSCLTSVNRDGTHHILRGINIVYQTGGFQFASTDKHRLTVAKVATDLTVLFKEKVDIIVPSEACKQFCGIFTVGRVTLTLYKNYIKFVDDTGNQLSTRLIYGNYPSVKKLIPEGLEEKEVLQIDTKLLLKSVKKILPFIECAHNSFTMDINNDGFFITDKKGKAVANLEAKTLSPKLIKSKYNIKYILDILTTTKQENIIYCATQPLVPGMFKHGNINTVLMPLKS